MTLPTSLTNLGVRDVISLDCEYIPRKGQPVTPVSVCAKSLVSGQEWRLFVEPGTRQACPLPMDPDIVYLAFSAPAEWSFFLAMGWELPPTVIDLYAEEMLLTCTQKNEKGKRYVPTLLHTLTKCGLDAMLAVEKEAMRDLILRGHPFTAEEREAVLSYNFEDTTTTADLLFRMLPYFDVGQAILRGNFTRAVGWMEFLGIPVDQPTFERLVKNWDGVRTVLPQKIEAEHGYNVFQPDKKGKMKWTSKGFDSLVARLGLQSEWPKTPTGKYIVADPDTGSDDDKIFKMMTQCYPYLEPLRQLRKFLTTLRRFKLPVGPDGRCRVHPWPFWTATGRSQPMGGGFIFSLPAWARFLIKPGVGQAIAYVDLIGAEFGIAAALSQDPAMLDSYASGEDVYLRLA